jgi:hypothetical protein
VERGELFDLAVNRSLSYARSVGLELNNKEKLEQGLELWYLKTRFAYRIPLDDITQVLESYPGTGTWTGGTDGMWQDPNKS